MKFRRPLLGALGAALALALAGCPDERKPAAPPKPAPTDEGPGGPGSDGGGAKPPAAAPAAFDRSKAKTPWKDVKVGDWAVYKMHGAGKTLRFEVTEVAGNAVTFTVKDQGSGELVNQPTVDIAEEETRYKDPMTYDALARDESGKEITPYTEAVEVAGKKLQALVVKRAKPGMGSTELWLAEKDVPPFNQCAIKSIRNGKLEVELLDFGRGQ